MQKCEKFNGVKLPGICEVLKNVNGPFYPVVKAFKPRLSCPILPGKYETMNSVVDVSPFAPLPVDGYTWVSTVKASSGEGKNRKLAMCLLMETKITLYKTRKNKN
ncbi:hypothetical protein PVAND_007858 [Polypedilum vanderplanki]|nr:hypothetical protein PVAND_007858 [Polypedilum vanderplanki]